MRTRFQNVMKGTQKPSLNNEFANKGTQSFHKKNSHGNAKQDGNTTNTQIYLRTDTTHPQQDLKKNAHKGIQTILTSHQELTKEAQTEFTKQHKKHLQTKS